MRRAILTEEPPRVVLGREGLPDPEDEITAALGRDEGPAVKLTNDKGQRVLMWRASTTLAIDSSTMEGARLAVLDGLEQSEAAGRTPADRAPNRRPLPPVRERNAERMARQAPAKIREESPVEDEPRPKIRAHR